MVKKGVEKKKKNPHIIKLYKFPKVTSYIK